MKIKAQPKLHISLSKEHSKYQSDVAEAFKGLDVSFDAGLMRFSAEEMTMQIMLNLGLGIASSAMWDGVKFGIKKLHKKFNTARITVQDSDSIMYTVKPDLSVIVLVVPDRMKEFEHIKTLDDLVIHLKNEPVKINSAGWKETKLTDIGVFSKGAGITKDQLTKTGHNAIRYGELYTKFDFKIEKIYSHIPTEILPTTTKIKYGDILLAGSGETNEEIGKSASYLLHEDCYAGGDLIIFSPKNANSLFLSYFLNIGEGRKKLTELGQGQSVVHIYKSEVEKLKLHLPSLPEQDHIVLVVETWDKSIEKLAQKIEAKKQIKKGLMQELLVGKKRLDGFKDKWETVELKEICEINPKAKSLPNSFVYIDLGSVENGVLLQENIINLLNAPSRAQRLLKSGDIIFQVVRPYQKNNLFFNKQGDYVASTGYAQIRAKNSASYLYWLLHTDTFVNKVIERCTGSNYPAINSTDLSEIEVDIPKSSEEQKAIAEILTTADKEITELEKKLNILKEQKRYLLNNLITGKIRTPETLSTKLTK